MTQKQEQAKSDRLEREAEKARHRPDELPPSVRGRPGSGAGDRHAAGAPMGGSAIGGLEGTNIGRGDPADVNIDAAQGSGDFERNLDADEETAYAGRDGGAVGGTPANKRVSGGNEPKEHPYVQPDVGESTVGRNPKKHRR